MIYLFKGTVRRQFLFLLSDGGRLPPLQAVRNKYVSVAGVNPPSDKRSARMRRDSEKYYVG